MTGHATLHGLNNVPSEGRLLQSHDWTIFLIILDEFSHQNERYQTFPSLVVRLFVVRTPRPQFSNERVRTGKNVDYRISGDYRGREGPATIVEINGIM